MQMRERKWRVSSPLERHRGEVTVGEAAPNPWRSARRVRRMRKWIAAKRAGGLAHGAAGRRPKNRTSQEVCEWLAAEVFNSQQQKQRQGRATEVTSSQSSQGVTFHSL